MDIINFLEISIKNNASDLHLSTGCCPMIRVDGDLHSLDFPKLTHQALESSLFRIISAAQKQLFKEQLDCDFMLEVTGLGRFRINAFHQSRGISLACRIIPTLIPCITTLGLSQVGSDILSLHQGMVLVTGPTGSGKSTTLAALVEHLNQHQKKHIVTIEDPIEFIHESRLCLIHQREVAKDAVSFRRALQAVLREDPDIIVIGELRDLETIRLALTAAETGHLVFATMHTNSSMKAIHRMMDFFPQNEQPLVRSMLAESLQVVIAQQLVKKIQGGRMLALEIMKATSAIRHLIREDKVAQMYSVIQTSHAQGMVTLEKHLTELVNQNLISHATANAVARS